MCELCDCDRDTDRCVYSLTAKGLEALETLDGIAERYALPVEALTADQGALDAARAEARQKAPELFVEDAAQ